MSSLEQIEAAILTLPLEEFHRLKQWLLEIDYQRWDEQLEQDIAEGKLDALADEAIAQFQASDCREILPQQCTQPQPMSDRGSNSITQMVEKTLFQYLKFK